MAQHVSSLDVPEVVGIAIILIGFSTLGLFLLRTKSVRYFCLSLNAAIALAVSVTEPPPIAKI